VKWLVLCSKGTSKLCLLSVGVSTESKEQGLWAEAHKRVIPVEISRTRGSGETYVTRAG